MNLGWLLRGWLARQAQAKVYETVAREAKAAVRDNVESAGRAAEELQRRGCDVGVVFALSIERGGLEDLLTDLVRTRGDGFRVTQGLLEGRSVALVQSGPGRRAARRATEALIVGHRPRWVISAGFAGALAPELKRGDILMATGVAAADAERLSIDLHVDPEALAATPGVHVGRLLTVDEVVCQPGEKRALGERHAAAAVDMETWAVADACRREQARFLAVRAISDSVDDELPREVRHMMRQRSTAGLLGAVTGSLVRRPGSAKDMLRLKQESLETSDRLARFLASMIVQLTPGDEGAKRLTGEQESGDDAP